MLRMGLFTIITTIVNQKANDLNKCKTTTTTTTTMIIITLYAPAFLF
jgi:hypothetical protein